jgi:hypothetical protein
VVLLTDPGEAGGWSCELGEWSNQEHTTCQQTTEITGNEGDSSDPQGLLYISLLGSDNPIHWLGHGKTFSQSTLTAKHVISPRCYRKGGLDQGVDLEESSLIHNSRYSRCLILDDDPQANHAGLRCQRELVVACN